MSADLLAFHLNAEKIPFTREFRFHPVRRWRFDFLLVSDKAQIAIEVDGGLFVRGRHSRGKGREADFVKLNEAVLMGYQVLQFSTDQVKRGEAIATIKRITQAVRGDVTTADGAGLPPSAANPFPGDPSLTTRFYRDGMPD